MTSATQSNSGASAYLAMLSSAIGDKPVIEPGDLDDQGVRDTVRQLLKGVERSSGSSGWLADLYVDAAASGTNYDAMWNYEAVIKETNDRLRQAGEELLYAVYPTDGVALADSPLGFVDHGRGEGIQSFFTDLVAYLQTETIQQRIADTGRRIPLSSVAGQPDPTWNYDPKAILTAIRMPEPEVIRQALNLYQGTLRKPSATAFCLDFSGSMEGVGERAMMESLDFVFTPDKAQELLVQWTGDDRVVAVPFDGQVRTTYQGTGDPAATPGRHPQQSRRRQHRHVCLRLTGTG